MSKRKSNLISELIVIFIIIVPFIGYDNAVKLMKEVLAQINFILVSLFDTSLLNELFQYSIVFTLVGIILTHLGSPRGKGGHYIGKGLYIIVSYFVGLLLDFVSKLIF